MVGKNHWLSFNATKSLTSLQGLLQATFQAIVNSSIKEMGWSPKLLHAVTYTLEEFRENCIAE